MRALRHQDHAGYRHEGPKRLGLTTADEQAWCRWYGECGYTATGVIVEWGSWLGSLTASTCEGLRRNSRAIERSKNGKILFAYDLFRWEPWCEDEVRNTEHAGLLTVGESFADYFRSLYAAQGDLLDARQADLATCGWDGPGIELVVNDAVKTLAIAENAFRHFVPALLPETGLMANQDYLWPTDAFLAVPMFLARDFFEYEYTVPDSCMVIFRCTREFVPWSRPLPSTLADVDPALLDEAFAWSRRTVQAAPAAMIHLGEAVTLWQAGHRERAERLVRDHRLATKRGSPMYDFQLDVLEMWGFRDLLDA